MKKLLTNNLFLKVLSLLIAFGLWVVIINIDDPVDQKTFSNIRIKMVNTNSLTDQNKVYEVAGGTDTVRVTVEASRSLLENLSSSDIVAEADFSDMSEENTVPISFYSLRSNDDIRKITGTIDAVKLNVEERKSKRLTLRTETIGEPEQGYVVGTPNMDQNRVEISGAESLISQISSAALRVDVTDSVSEISTYSSVILYDVEGNEVSNKTVSMNTTLVKVTIPILRTKEVPIVVETKGTPAAGYAATGEVSQSVDSVMIAGEESVVSGVNKIVIPAGDLDITGDTENLVKTYSLRRYLPDNVTIVDDVNTVTVTVYIEALKEALFRVPIKQLYIVGVPEKYTVVLDEDVDDCSLYLSGLKEDLDKVDVDELTGYIQVDNWMESMEYEEVEPGVYLLPVDFDIKGNVTQSRDVRVTVSIQIIEEM